MKITIETIQHDQQRYETCGDWFWTGDDLTIRVSDLGDWRKNAAVAVHELIEVLLCKNNGVSQDSVDKFDMNFEDNRKDGDLSEPGDDPKAPYHTEHCYATGVERVLVAALGMSWKQYDDAVNAL